MSLNPSQWPETLHKIYLRAAQDVAFRQRCLADAAGAIRETGGGDLPAGTRVRFVEKADETVLVLPPLTGTGELGDHELRDVAGGAPAGGTCTNASTITGHA